jgi:fatty-acyl-CoA synthase
MWRGAAIQRTVFIEATTIGDLVDRQGTRSDREALVFPDARVTYAQLVELTDDFARSLCALDVGPGDKVGILLPNCLDFVVALIATTKIGAVAVPINGRLRTHDLGQVIGHADVRVLLTQAGPEGTVDYPELITQVFLDLAEGDSKSLNLELAPTLRNIVDLGGSQLPGMMHRHAFESAASRVSLDNVKVRQERVRLRDIALLMYTSGTTSRPKGCLLTHEAIVRHGRSVALNRFALDTDDRFWDPLPLFHIGGIVPMLGTFAVGATYYHAGHFDPTQALDTLERERITVAYPAFETIWLGVLNHPRFAEADLSALRLIQNIAVPERLVQMQKALPSAIEVSSFGSTESSSNLTLTRSDDDYDARMHTLGHPLPGVEVRIEEPGTGRECAVDEVGELLFRGYMLFEGYYKEPELTAEAIDADGWFHSGDLAALDPDGRLIYAGRLKDMLKVGGENVSAVEVESFLAGHPAVEIVNVVGAPDARYGEVPAAFVQVRDGATLDEQELIEFCVGRIATYKIPRYVRVVHEWPMSGTKIQKFVLRERIAVELAERGVTEAPKIVTNRTPA